MRQYQDMLRHILKNGVDKGDRTGTGTRSVFGYQMRFDLQEGFPLVTTKFTSFKLIVSELLWFLMGNGNINWLHKHNNHIWDEWVFDDGTFGPIYGTQWRCWPSKDGQCIDQLQQVIDTLKTNPNDRRMIVSAWNVAEIDEMALPPCHLLFQFYVRPACNKGKKLEHLESSGATDCRPYLDCQLYQRSCDTFLGVPFNIASYSLLVHMIAKLVNMQPGHFVWTGGDVHIYHNHFEQVEELLKREPKRLPKLLIKGDHKSIDAYSMDDFLLVDYDYHPPIKAPVAV